MDGLFNAFDKLFNALGEFTEEVKHEEPKLVEQAGEKGAELLKQFKESAAKLNKMDVNGLVKLRNEALKKIDNDFKDNRD